ncbi:MAG TPA: hypothetical protein VEZ71_29335 [Archangium sp.]|nr:hypothetical protein [Archangium sp.]
MVIAGSGLAAAATALRLLEFGLRPLLLARELAVSPGVESLPEEALRFFTALGLESALLEAGAVRVEGFDNAWEEGAAVLKPGVLWHVERAALARRVLAEAVARGASVLSVPRVPVLEEVEGAVRVTLEGETRTFLAAVDATGRSACWSRPVRAQGRQVARLFQVAPDAWGLRGRLCRAEGAWGYRLGLPEGVTVGLVTPDNHLSEPTAAQLHERLRLQGATLRPLGQRPAFPQWTESPVRGRRISVGDAALAHDPLAGQGMRFALGTALAAVAVMRGWVESSPDARTGEDFYRELVEAERHRHLSLLARFHERGSSETPGPLPTRQVEPFPARVRFAGTVQTVGLHQDGRILPGEALCLPDGSRVRWLGRIDLLLLRELCPGPTPLPALLRRLEQAHLAHGEPRVLVQWALSRKVLVDATQEP